MRLPIDVLLPEIVDHLRGGSALVIDAPPGARKTTRVPSRLAEPIRGAPALETPLGATKTTRVPAALLSRAESTVLLLAPRRLAARMREQIGELGK